MKREQLEKVLDLDNYAILDGYACLLYTSPSPRDA